MLYDYRCTQCDSITEKANTVAERRTNAPECCGQKMTITILTGPEVHFPAPVYYRCPVTNEGVTSKRQRREIMARNHLLDANDIIKPKQWRDKKEQETEKLRNQEHPKELVEQVNQWARKQVYGG